MKSRKPSKRWLLSFILTKIRMIQKEQKQNSRKSLMHMKHYLIQRRERSMINMVKKVLKDRQLVRMLAGMEDFILTQMISLSNSLEEVAVVVVAQAISSTSNSTLEVVAGSMVIINNNNKSNLLKIYLRTQMSLSWTWIRSSNFTDVKKFGFYSFTTPLKRKANNLKMNIEH